MPSRAAKPMILDFVSGRVWQPEDEGYEKRRLEILEAIAKHQTGHIGAIPPGRFLDTEPPETGQPCD